MVLRPDIHNPNDITNRYFSEVVPEKFKHYFKLPGKFVSNFPTKIYLRDGSERETDWLILTKQDDGELLILIEFQSYAVDEKKMQIIADCADYSKIYYGRPVLVVIIITDGYESSKKEYHRTASDILKPIYIQMSEEEISKRLNNLEVKILNHEKLSDDEAFDLVFLPMFASRSKAEEITEKNVHLFKRDESIAGVFRGDIAFGLSIMIRKYFDLTEKGKELLKLIEPELDKSRLKDVIDYEVDYMKKSYENELSEKDEALAKKDSAIAKQNKALAKKDSAIAKQNKALAEKDEQIRILTAKLKENGIN